MTADKTCMEPGCGAVVYARGRCRRHYQQARAAAAQASEAREAEEYQPSEVWAALAKRLEAERDELIAAGADDRTKLETLRSIAREHRAQYRHTPCTDWRRGVEVEL